MVLLIEKAKLGIKIFNHEKEFNPCIFVIQLKHYGTKN